MSSGSFLTENHTSALEFLAEQGVDLSTPEAAALALQDGELAELENVLTDHPEVIEAAVFGVPSERWGESPYAVVTVGDGATVTGDELIALCADRLGSYKKPATVELTTEELPKSPVGKLARKVLREPHWEGHDRRVAGN